MVRNMGHTMTASSKVFFLILRHRFLLLVDCVAGTRRLRTDVVVRVANTTAPEALIKTFSVASRSLGALCGTGVC